MSNAAVIWSGLQAMTKPAPACPACGAATPRVLDASSAFAMVTYFRCGSCQHIWTVDKYNPTLIHHVTPLPQKPAV